VYSKTAERVKVLNPFSQIVLNFSDLGRSEQKRARLRDAPSDLLASSCTASCRGRAMCSMTNPQGPFPPSQRVSHFHSMPRNAGRTRSSFLSSLTPMPCSVGRIRQRSGDGCSHLWPPLLDAPRFRLSAPRAQRGRRNSTNSGRRTSESVARKLTTGRTRAWDRASPLLALGPFSSLALHLVAADSVGVALAVDVVGTVADLMTVPQLRLPYYPEPRAGSAPRALPFPPSQADLFWAFGTLNGLIFLTNASSFAASSGPKKSGNLPLTFSSPIPLLRCCRKESSCEMHTPVGCVHKFPKLGGKSCHCNRVIQGPLPCTQAHSRSSQHTCKQYPPPEKKKKPVRSKTDGRMEQSSCQMHTQSRVCTNFEAPKRTLPRLSRGPPRKPRILAHSHCVPRTCGGET